MEDILKAWDAPYKWLKWLNLNNCDEELLKMASLHERFIVGQQGKPMQSIRANGNNFVGNVMGTVMLPNNAVHSGKALTESAETTITALI